MSSELPKSDKPTISKKHTPGRNKVRRLIECIFPLLVPSYFLSDTEEIAGQVRLTIPRGGKTDKFLVIPLSKFELILDCCGSYMAHFSIDKSTIGKEGRLVLMMLLEPLLGERIPYGALLNSVHVYLGSKRYKSEREGLKDNMKRYLDEVSRQLGGK